MAALVDRYVRGADGRRYLKLLSGAFAGLPDAERTAFLQSLVADARSITDDELDLLFADHWRPRLAAAWLVAAADRERFRAKLGSMLLASETVYASRGYCFALAYFGTAEDAAILVAYLDHYLTVRPRLEYDQRCAMGALLHIDERSGTNRAARFLAPGGPWHEWNEGRWDATGEKRLTTQLCALVSTTAKGMPQ